MAAPDCIGKIVAQDHHKAQFIASVNMLRRGILQRKYVLIGLFCGVI
jgi:hypothetical protein